MLIGIVSFLSLLGQQTGNHFPTTMVRWERTELAPGGRIDAIADLGDGILVAGARGASYGRIFRSTDYGKSWQQTQTIASGQQGAITCLARGLGQDAYLLTEQGDFWRSEDHGKTWRHLTHITTNKNRDGFAAAYGIMVTPQGTILVSNTDSDGGHVFRSTDRGSRWQDLGKISTKGLYRFVQVGKGVVLNGWDGSIYLSQDDGQTWQQAAMLEQDQPIYATEYLGAAAVIQASFTGNIYKGDTFGHRWRKVDSLAGAADDFAYLGNGVVLYSTYTGKRDMYLSVDAGETWQNIGGTGTGVAGDWMDHVITVPAAESVICIGGTSKGYILRMELTRDELYGLHEPASIGKVRQQTSSSLQFASAHRASYWNPTELDEPEDVLIDGQYAYIPNRDGNNLAVLDISNPDAPRLVSSFRDGDLLDAMGVAKAGDILYLTSLTNHKLLILDASNPLNLQKISSLTIGGEGRTADRVRKVTYADGYAYVTHSSEGTVYVCDVRNPADPRVVGRVTTGDGAFAVYPHGDYAYVGGCFPGASLKVIDIRKKDTPTVVATLPDSGRYGCLCHFEIKGQHLYAVAYSSNAFVSFDISNPARPREVGYLRSDLLAGPGRLALTDSSAYVINSINDSFAQIDIADPTRPRLVHVLSDRRIEKAYGLAVAGGFAYIAGRDSKSLTVLQLDRIHPTERGVVSYLRDSIALNAPEDIIIRNGIAYIPCRDGGSLTLVDVTEPSHPRIRQVFWDTDITDAMGLDIHENHLYLTSMTNRTLVILDISDPDHIQKIAAVQLGEDGPNIDRLRKVVYRDNHLFVTHGNSGTLFILNIDNPEKPRLVSQVQTGDGAFNVYLHGDYAYVGGCGGTSLKVIDIRDLAQPKLVNTLRDRDKYSCLCSFSVQGNHLYAIGYFSRSFVVFDISDPANPREVGLIRDDRIHGANRLSRHGNQVYIATALTDGMVQVDVSEPTRPRIVHMISTQLLDKAYGITYHNGLVYAVGRDADSMVVLDPQAAAGGKGTR